MKRIAFLLFVIFIPLLFSLVSAAEVIGTLPAEENATAGLPGDAVVTGDVITTTTTATTSPTTTVSGGGGGGGGGGGTTTIPANVTTTTGTTTIGTTTTETTAGTTAPTTTAKVCGVKGDRCGKNYPECCSGLICKGNKCVIPKPQWLDITPTTGIIIGVTIVIIIAIISVVYFSLIRGKIL